MVFLTVSTGVGGGVVLNGKLQTGSGGLAGHLGTRWPILTGRFAAAGAEAALRLLRRGAVLPLRHKASWPGWMQAIFSLAAQGVPQARRWLRALRRRWRGSLLMLKLSPTAGMLS
jgi:N-acylmannosamine kinase